MTIQKTREGNTLVVALEGRLDTLTAPEFEEAMEKEEAEKIVVDLEKLEYVSSAGLRVLLKLNKRQMGNGSFSVRKPSEMVMEVFDVTGFNDILDIEE